jgi:hypothetical protein
MRGRNRRMKRILSLAPIFLLLAGCGTTQIDVEKMIPADIKEGERYISMVRDINGKVPETFTADISVNAKINRKNFKTTGTMHFASTPLSVRIKLIDLILRMSLVDMLMVDNTMKIYQPLEKTMVVRRVEPLADFISPDIDPAFVSTLMLERIPLIKKAKVSRSYQSEDEKARVVVIENDAYFESIYFNGNMPEKALIISKIGKSKYEIHFFSPVTISDRLFFEKITATASDTGNTVIVEYSNIKVNLSIDRLKVFSITVPTGTKIIEQ